EPEEIEWTEGPLDHVPLFASRLTDFQEVTGGWIEATLLDKKSASHCSQAKPLHRLHIALRHTQALVVHERQIVLRSQVAWASSEAIPLCRLRIVFRHPLARIVHLREHGLRISVALVGSEAIPFHRL